MRRARGFTLVELLIVIAIIGILAAIAIPNLLSAVQRGRQKRTMADLRSLATALEAYAVDNNVYPQGACPDGSFFTTDVLLDEASFSALVPNYIARAPRTDGWGHPFLYGADDPGQQYVLVSTGRDGVAGAINCGTTTNFNDDIVYSNGGFIQWPEGIQK